MPRDLRGPYPADDIPPATDVLQMFLFFLSFSFGGETCSTGRGRVCWIIILLRSAHPVIYGKALPLCFFGCWPIYISILFLFPVDLYMRIHNSPCCCSFYLGDIHLYFYITFVILFYFWLPRPLDCERGSADITVVLYKRWKSALNMTCVAFLSSRDDVTFHPFSSTVFSLYYVHNTVDICSCRARETEPKLVSL